MIRLNFAALLMMAFALSLSAPHTAHAAESYDNCTGFITSVPAVITTPGTWCLKQNLTTSITDGNAITIAANNITLDCNDFKLGDLAAGPDTEAIGVFADTRLNATVRRCNVRGFKWGINLNSGSGDAGGYAVEDNLVDGSTYIGIVVFGDGSVVRRNRVFNTTNASSGNPSAYGIITLASVDVTENLVSGVFSASGGDAVGIDIFSNSIGSVNNNRVRNVGGGGATWGVWAGSGHVTLRDNDIVASAAGGGIGLNCQDSTGQALGNVINGFAVGLAGCNDDGGNVIAP